MPQTTKSGYQDTKYQKSARCHEGFTAIHQNIFLGRKYDVDKVLKHVDVLIPLDSVGGDIWKNGFKGDILYIPITDYSVLPVEVEDLFVNKVLKLINEGKKVAIFCIGGHGRTGYFASLLLGRLGVEDPIEYIRNNYCKESVETNSQVSAIAEYLGKPELATKHKITYSSYSNYYSYGKSYSDYDYSDCYSYNNEYWNSKSKIGFQYNDTKKEKSCEKFCEDCEEFYSYDDNTGEGYCFEYECNVNGCDSCIKGCNK